VSYPPVAAGAALTVTVMVFPDATFVVAEPEFVVLETVSAVLLPTLITVDPYVVVYFVTFPVPLHV
jgi:hypothetical protein